jgi:hypothetical protein
MSFSSESRGLVEWIAPRPSQPRLEVEESSWNTRATGSRAISLSFTTCIDYRIFRYYLSLVSQLPLTRQTTREPRRRRETSRSLRACLSSRPSLSRRGFFFLI